MSSAQMYRIIESCNDWVLWLTHTYVHWHCESAEHLMRVYSVAVFLRSMSELELNPAESPAYLRYCATGSAHSLRKPSFCYVGAFMVNVQRRLRPETSHRMATVIGIPGTGARDVRAELK